VKIFTLAEIERLRWLRTTRRPMESMVLRMPGHTRAEVVEAIDATVRHQNNHDALRHVNQVLAYQWAEIPLINGKPQAEVIGDIRRSRYAPMFK